MNFIGQIIGGSMSGDTFNVSGQAAVVGPRRARPRQHVSADQSGIDLDALRRLLAGMHEQAPNCGRASTPSVSP
jgi:hypothetical protein